MENKWCKFCKNGYGVFEKGQYNVYCYLSHFSYPIKKDPQDTCEDFEDDEDIEEE